MENGKAGLTPYVILVIALTFLCNVFLGEETRAISLSTPHILKEFGITGTQLGFAQTVAAWVGLIGWFGVLIIADGMGRKPAFIAVLAGYTLTAPLIGFAGNFLQLSTLLALAAIPRNTGTINYMVLAETVPPSFRAWLLSFLNSSVPLAYMMTALLAGFMVPRFGWRSLFFFDALCVILLVVAWVKMRETDPFIAARSHRQSLGKRQRPDLLLPWRLYPGRAFLGFCIQVVYLGAYPSFSAWQTTWLVKEVGIPFAQSTDWVAIWLGCSTFAYWICGWISNRFGKKIAVPLFAGIGGCFFVAVIFGRWSVSEIFWLGLGLNFFVTGHYGSGSYAYVNELFPAQIRGSVQASFALVVGFVVSWAPTIPPWIAGNAMEHISLGFIFPMVLTFAAAGIFLFIAPETAGKPLDDVVEEKA